MIRKKRSNLSNQNRKKHRKKTKKKSLQRPGSRRLLSKQSNLILKIKARKLMLMGVMLLSLKMIAKKRKK